MEAHRDPPVATSASTATAATSTAQLKNCPLRPQLVVTPNARRRYWPDDSDLNEFLPHDSTNTTPRATTVFAKDRELKPANSTGFGTAGVSFRTFAKVNRSRAASRAVEGRQRGIKLAHPGPARSRETIPEHKEHRGLAPVQRSVKLHDHGVAGLRKSNDSASDRLKFHDLRDILRAAGASFQPPSHRLSVAVSISKVR